MQRVVVLIFVLINFLFAQDILRYDTTKNFRLADLKNLLELNNYQIESTSRLEKSFEHVFNDTRFSRYRVVSVYEKDLATQLVLKYPDASIFTPFSIALVSYKGSSTTSILFLSSEAIKKVTKVNDNLIDKIVDKNIQMAKIMGGILNPLNFDTKKMPNELMYKKVFKTQDAQKVADMVEKKMEEKDFIFMNYLYLKDISNEIDENFDFFTIASLCKKEVLHYTSDDIPEAIVFAPCSLSIYKKKGSNETIVAFNSIYTWVSLLNITNNKATKALINEQKMIEKLIDTLQKELN